MSDEPTIEPDAEVSVPQIADGARGEIMSALETSVDAILAKPNAAAIMSAFLAQSAVIFLSHGSAQVLPVAGDLPDALARIALAAVDLDDDDPEPDDGSAFGTYL